MYIASTDKELLNECYQAILEANLYDKQPLIDAIDNILKEEGVKDQPIIDWFKTHYVNWFTSPKDDSKKNIKKHKYAVGEPEWAKNTFDFVNLNKDKDKIINIISYFLDLPEIDLNKIKKEPYDQISKKVDKWNSQNNKKVESGKEGIDFKTVMRFKDGYSIVRLISVKEHAREGEGMQHCMRDDPKHYCEDQYIFSLRDSKGESHITISATETGAIMEIKGKQNARPKPKYIPYLREFIESSGMPVKVDGSGMGMVPYGDQFYFEDSPEWGHMLKTVIEPLQRKTFNSIKRGETTDINLSDLFIKQLPKWFETIEIDDLDLSGNPISVLPNFKYIGGSLTLDNTNIDKLPNNLKIGGSLSIANIPINQLPSGLSIGEELNCIKNTFVKLPDDISVGWNINILETPITSLPNNFNVEGSLYLKDVLLKELPARLVVKQDLTILSTPIEKLPKDLIVFGNLYLKDTPMSKYTSEQLKQMLPKVKGKIIIK